MAHRFPEALAHFQAGRYDEAVAGARAILAGEPRHVDALQLLGLALSAGGRSEEAIAPLEELSRLRPNQAHLLTNLGEIYRLCGRLTDAERVLREAVRLQPRLVEASFNLGNVLKDQDRYDEAIALYQQAIAIRPDYAKAHLNLANTLRHEGRHPRALLHYREVLRLQPPKRDVLMSLGGTHSDLGEHETAAAIYAQAARLEPENEETQIAIGNTFVALGQIGGAAPTYRRIAAAHPRSLLKRLRAEMLCDVIAPRGSSIDEHRRRVLPLLGELRDEVRAGRLTLDVGELHCSGAEPPMAWAYQGRDDRPLKEAYAALISEVIRPLELPPRTGRPRVGIVVTNGHEGVYRECLGRLVARLATTDMRVTVVCSRAGGNILRFLMPEANVEYLRIPDRVDEAAQVLRDAEFDLLHYWEVGTDSTNYFLPFFRPAPAQSACWGWPVTSGLPTIGHYVSSRLIESDDADAHYTEQLVRLETLPTWYQRPPVPPRKSDRTTFGFRPGHAYFCTQNLRKYHPEFDAILGDILRRDPEGTIYAIEDSQRPITQQLRERFERTIPDVAGRIVFFPRRERFDYLQRVAHADVILDTPHYGGGANSLYDAFSCGQPVVTWPTGFHRGRFALGAYGKMGRPDLVASTRDDYIAFALRIAGDRDFRDHLRADLQARCEVLFEDQLAIREHEAFFQRTIAAARV